MKQHKNRLSFRTLPGFRWHKTVAGVKVTYCLFYKRKDGQLVRVHEQFNLLNYYSDRPLVEALLHMRATLKAATDDYTT